MTSASDIVSTVGSIHWHLWIGFIAASALIGVIPGPGVVSILGYALGSGRRVALASVAGMACGNTIAMSLSLAGVGALLAASALAFSIVKWIGALYLIGLGIISLWRSRTHLVEIGTRPAQLSARTAFAGNVAIGTFHPKTIVFFVAFVPQFISTDAPYAAQAALLVATFCMVVAATDTAYALVASKAARLIRGRRAVLWSRRAGGAALIASGLATATAHR